MESNNSIVNEKMEHNVSVSARLRSERKRLGIKQEDLANIGGVTRQTQSKYEKGERGPNTDYLERVAQIGVDVLYVITGRRLSSDSDEAPKTLSNPESPVKTSGYDESEPEAENRNAVPISGLELEPDEAQWLEWYRQIKPEDRELVEPVVRGFADRGKRQLSGLELEPDEAQWLEWYRQIKLDDRELVEPVVRGFADRGKGQQIKDTG